MPLDIPKQFEGEADPREGTIEEKIAEVFGRVTRHPLSIEREYLESELQKVIPGAKVFEIFRPTKSKDVYFLNQVDSLCYYRIEFGGKNFLLPKPMSPNAFVGNRYARVGNSEEFLSFEGTPSSHNIQPIPLKLNGQRWEADIPEAKEKKAPEPTPPGKTGGLESKPEKEGTIEEKIAEVFGRWIRTTREYNVVDFEMDLEEEEGFSSAQVRLVYKTTADERYIFLNERVGSAVMYFKVNVGGEDFLLPRPISPSQFEAMDYAEIGRTLLVRGKKLSFVGAPGDISIQPIPLSGDSKKGWKVNIPETRVETEGADKGISASREIVEGEKIEINEAEVENIIAEVFNELANVGGYSEERLQADLRKKIPEARVFSFFRPMVGGVYFVTGDKRPAQTWWYIGVEVGGRNYLLPRLTGVEKGDDILEFDAANIRPVRITKEGGRWVVSHSEEASDEGSDSGIDFDVREEEGADQTLDLGPISGMPPVSERDIPMPGKEEEKEVRSPSDFDVREEGGIDHAVSGEGKLGKEGTIESGPEKEGTIEERIGNAYQQVINSEVEFWHIGDLQNALSEKISGVAVSVIWRPREYVGGNEDCYFIDENNALGSALRYIKVEFEGNNYLLPRSSKKGEFDRLNYGDNDFDPANLRAVPIKRVAGRWELDSGDVGAEKVGEGKTEGVTDPSSAPQEERGERKDSRVEAIRMVERKKTKKEQAYDLFEEFFTLTNELRKLRKDEVVKGNPRDFFEAEFDGLDDTDATQASYMNDLRARNKVLKGEIEALKSGEGIKGVGAQSGFGGLSDDALGALDRALDSRGSERGDPKKESDTPSPTPPPPPSPTPDKAQAPEKLKEKIPFPFSFNYEGPAFKFIDEAHIDDMAKKEYPSISYYVGLESISKMDIILPAVRRVFDGGKVKLEEEVTLAGFLSRLATYHSDRNSFRFLVDSKDAGEFSERERPKFDGLETKDGRHFSDFSIEVADLVAIFEKAKDILDQRIAEAKRRKALKKPVGDGLSNAKGSDVGGGGSGDVGGGVERVESDAGADDESEPGGTDFGDRVDLDMGGMPPALEDGDVPGPADQGEGVSMDDVTSDLPPDNPGDVSGTGRQEGVGAPKVDGKKEGGTEKIEDPKKEIEGERRVENGERGGVEGTDQRTSLFLKSKQESTDLDLQSFEEDYASLKEGTEGYFKALRDCVRRYFIAPSMDSLDPDSVFCWALTRLVFLHNKVSVRSPLLPDFQELKDFAQFRKKNLDSVTVGDGTFADFAIEQNDLEEIFRNAKWLLDQKIGLAKKLKAEKRGTPEQAGPGPTDEGEAEDAPEREEATDLEPKPPKRKLPVAPRPNRSEVTPVEPVSMSPEDVRRRREEILSGGRRRSGTPERAVEDEPQESAPTLRDVRQEKGKSWHKWAITGGGLSVVAGGLLLLYGDKEGKKTEESDPGMTPSASTNRIEHIEESRTNAPAQLKGAEVVAMERGLTNYVSPLYLAKLHLADGLKVLPNAPIVSGFEQIDPELADNLKVVWSDENGFYPKGWVSGKFLAINYSTGQDTNTLQRYGTNVTGRVVGTYNQATRSLNFYTNSNFEVKLADNKSPSNLAPKALDDVFSHEVGHANDWISNFNLPYERRLALLDSIIGRLNSDDRIKFSYVESIDEKKFDLKAEEYWAELCSEYFRSPKNLKERHPKDFAIIDGVVEETCKIVDVPKFNPVPSSQAKYEVARNWETRKGGVVLLHGGLTGWQDYMKRVVWDLKGVGGKPAKFDAFTETPIKK